MTLGIRKKLVFLLVVASALPLVLAVVAISTVGYRSRVAERRMMFRNEAVHVAGNLQAGVDQRLWDVSDLLRFSDLSMVLDAGEGGAEGSGGESFLAQMRARDRAWEAAPADSPEVVVLLTNAVARRLKRFQERHPDFAELLVTDRRGRLVGATGKTSDYYQADETWWQRAIGLPPGQALAEGLHYDASASVYSLDVAMPVWRPDDREAGPLGVIKAVLNTRSLFASVPLHFEGEDVAREVVAVEAEGPRALLTLEHNRFTPGSDRLPSAVADRLRPGQDGSFTVEMSDGRRHMAGFAPLRLTGVFGRAGSVEEGPAVYVLVHQGVSAALAPLRRQLFLLTGAGLLLVIGFPALGVYLGSRNFIRPLKVLSAAARTMAGLAGTETGSAEGSSRRGEGSGAEELRRVRGIRTGDEIEVLARNFDTMALRVLSYQDHLEREIALRTAEIQSDLALAREFQQALLPHDYPAVGGNGGPGGCGLQFHHLYRPAASLSGDFFDVLKLSENRVGVFVADVMGHGTRSALVTAILRTLLPEVARSAADPGDVLAALNTRFVESLDHTGQKVFVSGIYLVADVEAGTVRFASAGHPSPLVVNRSTGTVSALFDRLRHNPALGLFPGVNYETFRRPLLMTDLFVFYTDGVVEAVDDRDEEFGRDRLEEVMSRHRMADAAGLAGAVGTSVSRFLGGRPAADDICLVVMEVLPSRGGGAREAPGRS